MSGSPEFSYPRPNLIYNFAFFYTSNWVTQQDQNKHCTDWQSNWINWTSYICSPLRMTFLRVRCGKKRSKKETKGLALTQTTVFYLYKKLFSPNTKPKKRLAKWTRWVLNERLNGWSRSLHHCFILSEVVSALSYWYRVPSLVSLTPPASRNQLLATRRCHV